MYLPTAYCCFLWGLLDSLFAFCCVRTGFILSSESSSSFRASYKSTFRCNSNQNSGVVLVALASRKAVAAVTERLPLISWLTLSRDIPIFDVVTAPENVFHDSVRNIIPDEQARSYWKSVLRMAALCHDLGHLPFS